MKTKPIQYKTRKWAFMLREDIMDAVEPEKVYLRRFRILQTPWFAFYLHRIYLPDRDRHPHDHPWPFLSVILRGGYDETMYYTDDVTNSLLMSDKVVFARDRRWSVGSVHSFRTTWAHQITTIKPGTISLVITGRRCRQWGFWVEDGKWIPWPEYNATKLTTDQELDPFQI